MEKRPIDGGAAPPDYEELLGIFWRHEGNNKRTQNNREAAISRARDRVAKNLADRARKESEEELEREELEAYR